MKKPKICFVVSSPFTAQVFLKNHIQELALFYDIFLVANFDSSDKKKIRELKLKEIKHIPIWMSHGKFDKVSSYIVAKQMADSLDLYGANIKFQTLQTGHWGWNEIYKDSASINWFLSWKNKK